MVTRKYEVVVLVSAVADHRGAIALFVHQHTGALSCVLLVQLNCQSSSHTHSCCIVFSCLAMGALFSWNKRAAEPQRQSKVTAQDRAVLDLKIARDKAQRYKKKVCVVCGVANESSSSSSSNPVGRTTNAHSFVSVCCVSLWLSLTADTRCRKVHGSCQACHGCQEEGAANQPL